MTQSIKHLALIAILSTTAFAAKKPADYREFPSEKLKPGETQVAELKKLLGAPIRSMREGSREYYFYDLGDGATMDATVLVKQGVVEYATFLCNDNLKEYRGQEREVQKLEGGLQQIMFTKIGKGFVVSARTMKVRACLSFKPGTNPQG